jgi:ribosome maturation factor RimP
MTKREEYEMKTEQLLLPIMEENNFELYDVEFVKEAGTFYLRAFIDKEGGVDLNACEAFSNAISDPLDLLDPTFGLPYTFNVSSPGVDRPFKKDEDFISHIGKMVEVKLYNSIKGKKLLEGVLQSYDGERIVVKTDEKTTLSIELKNVVKVNEYVEFN